jgi:hypothetical protein
MIVGEPEVYEDRSYDRMQEFCRVRAFSVRERAQCREACWKLSLYRGVMEARISTSRNPWPTSSETPVIQTTWTP